MSRRNSLHASLFFFFFSLSLASQAPFPASPTRPVRVKGERLPATATAVVSVAAGFADSQTTMYC